MELKLIGIEGVGRIQLA